MKLAIFAFALAAVFHFGVGISPSGAPAFLQSHTAKEWGDYHHGDDDHGDDSHGHDEHGDYHDSHGHDSGHGSSHGYDSGHGSSHGHDDHGHGSSHGHDDHGHHGPVYSEGAKSVALCLVSGVFVIPVILYMALNPFTSHITLKMVDTFVSIFLAVLWFNFCRTAIHVSGVGTLFPFAEQIVELAYLAILYISGLVIAFALKEKMFALVIFCGMGAHFIAFAGIQACGSTQAFVAYHTDDVVGPASSFGVCLAVLAVFVGVSVPTRLFILSKIDNKKFLESVDEFELDICGLVMSFIITQGVRHVITGHYPPMAHMFVQMNGHHGPEPLERRITMLAWAALLTAASAVLLPKLHVLDHKGYWAAKCVRVSKVVFIMCIAWGYLLWGQWEFFTHFSGDPMFGQQLFAVFATMVCVFIVIGMAHLDVTSRSAKETKGITLTGVSLAAAWSWEHCFNTAFDIIGEEYQVGFGGLVPKGALAILIPAFLLPVYLQYLKPLVVEIVEEEEAEEEKEAEEEAREAEESARKAQ